MNNHDLAEKIAKRLLREYQVGTMASNGCEFDPVSEEELAELIEEEIEANGD